MATDVQQLLFDWTGRPIRTGILADSQGVQLVAPGASKYSAVSQRGRIWTISTPPAGVVIAAANVSPLPAGTGQPLVGVFVQRASKFKVSVLRTLVWSNSGTPGGMFAWNVITSPTGITAASVNAVNQDTFQSAVPDGAVRVYQNTALTGSALATLLRAIGGSAAAAAVGSIGSVSEETAGAITVEPDQFAGIAVAAVGAAWNAGAAIEFELVPV